MSKINDFLSITLFLLQQVENSCQIVNLEMGREASFIKGGVGEKQVFDVVLEYSFSSTIIGNLSTSKTLEEQIFRY